MKYKLLSLIAITLSIGLMAVLNSSALPISKTQQAFAAANCDKANLEKNDQGKTRGNSKQCGDFGSTTGGPKEPNRDCDSPNAFKDNDDDGIATCVFRGN